MACFQGKLLVRGHRGNQSWNMVAANVLEKKQTTVEEVKELLSNSYMIVSFPTEGYTHKELSELRKKIPSSKIKVVKNTLMKRAIQGSPYQCLESEVCRTNAWLFLPEDFKPTVEEFQKINKELKKETSFRFGVLEKTVYTAEDLERVLKLPSKKELLAQIAFALKAVPTQLAIAIQAVPTKLARSIQLAKETEQVPKSS
eukprot:jgi/Galph1/1973/GphlegSOOS_G631.1